MRKLPSRQHKHSYFCSICFKSKIFFQHCCPGEGRKPSHEEYIAESEFALLGILSKQCLMIHFYLRCMPVDDTDRSGNNNKRLTFFFRCEKHYANVRGLANATLCYHSESSEHSRNSLGRCTTCTMLRLKTLLNMFNSYSSGVPTKLREKREHSL